MITTQLDAGRLIRIRHDVYLAAADWPPDPVQQHVIRARAELAVTPEAVVSHESAALLWELPSPGFTGWQEFPVSLTVPRGGRHRRRHGALQHVGPLPANHLALGREGYPVTNPVRTAIDLARGRPLPEALVLLDAAARITCAAFVAAPSRATYRNPRLAQAALELLAEAASVRRIASLGQALSITDPGRESAIESLSAGHLYLSGLEMPLFQEPIATPFGTFFPDCYWPAARLIGEADGAVKYQQAGAFVREKEREQILRDQGYRMVRWLGKEIMTSPGRVMQRIARALETS